MCPLSLELQIDGGGRLPDTPMMPSRQKQVAQPRCHGNAPVQDASPAFRRPGSRSKLRAQGTLRRLARFGGGWAGLPSWRSGQARWPRPCTCPSTQGSGATRQQHRAGPAAAPVTQLPAAAKISLSLGKGSANPKNLMQMARRCRLCGAAGLSVCHRAIRRQAEHDTGGKKQRAERLPSASVPRRRA